MATKIVLKNGSGAPLASDLVQGEVGLDLTNKRIYTEDSGGTVIEMGTSPSTIDINAGTVDGISSLSTANGTDVSFAGVSATKFFWDASAESLGIGTSSPATALDVVGEVRNSGNYSSSGNAVFYSYNGGTAGTVRSGIQAVGSDTTLRMYTNGTERARIDSSGNLLVGTTTAGGKLTVSAASNHISLIESDNSNKRWDIGQNGGALIFTEFGVADRMRIDSSGRVGIGTSSPLSPLHVRSATDVNVRFDDNSGTSRTWYMNDAANAYIVNEMLASEHSFLTNGLNRMRIDWSGNLLVGTTTTGATTASDGVVIDGSTGQLVARSDSGTVVYVNKRTSDGNAVAFYRDTTAVGTISVTGSTTTYNITSDQRLKENITDAPAGNVDDIKVRSFDWKADGSHQEYGMVAQELEAVAPYAVTKGETEDDMWSVDYSKLVPMLIKEIQDLKAEVAALKGA